MRKYYAAALSLCLVICALVLASSTARDVRPANPSMDRDVRSQIRKLRVPFVPNEGQADPSIAYYASTFGGIVSVDNDGAIRYSLPVLEAGKMRRGVTIHETFLGSARQNSVGIDQAQTRVNYFRGNDRSRWKSDLPTFETVSLGKLYEGIEIRIKAHANSAEKLFVVSPEGDPSTIRAEFSGADSVQVTSGGELELGTPYGPVRFSKPVAYQVLNGRRTTVDVAYVATAKGYGFRTGAYDRTEELVIDPLLASTYLGGSLDEAIQAIAIGSEGMVYVAGYTCSTNFPEMGAFAGEASRFDAFAACLTPDLTTLLYSTVFGGSASDSAQAMGILNGYVYVAGYTSSSDYPVTESAYDNQCGTDGACNADPAAQIYVRDGFVTKFSGDLSLILDSTYLGGSKDDGVAALAVDLERETVNVTGFTYSSDFPADSRYGWAEAAEMAFVSSFDATLTVCTGATLGGSGTASGNAIALVPGGAIYVAGTVSGGDFPATAGAYRTSPAGNFDVFVAKFGYIPSLDALSYLGGSESEEPFAVVVDAAGVLLAGTTSSNDFPATDGAYSTVNSGGNDAFISRFDLTLTQLTASTYLGGSDFDTARALVLGTDGTVYAGGATYSDNFPVSKGEYLSYFHGTSGTTCDAFSARLTNDLTAIMRASYLGGYEVDGVRAMAMDSSNQLYLAGFTRSQDFPVRENAFMTWNQGAMDGFIAVGFLDNPWPMFHRGASHDGASPLPGTQTGHIRWLCDVNGPISSSPAIGSDGRVYFASESGSVFSYDAKTGSQIWQIDTGEYILSSPALGDGIVYLGSGTTSYVEGTDYGYVLAIDSSYGYERWRFNTETSAHTSPVIGQDGTVYIGTYGGVIFAIDPYDGYEKWRYQAAAPILSTPTVQYDGTVYACALDGTVYALDSGGSAKWTTTLDSPIYATPALAEDGTLYVGTDAGILYALSTTDGSTLWSLNLISTIYSSPAIQGTALYVGAGSSLVAVDTQTHTQTWKISFESSIRSSPAVSSDGTVYVGTYDYAVCAMEPQNGTVVWYYPTKSGIQSSPALGTDGTVYIADKSGRFYALGDPDSGPNVFVAPPFTSFGTVEVGSSSSSATIEIHNTGDSDLTVSDITQDNPAQFSLTGDYICPSFPAVIASGAKCSVTLTFVPQDAGYHYTTVTVSSDAANNPAATVSADGWAENPPQPSIGVSPGYIDYGLVLVETSQTTFTTITNQGTADLSLSNISTASTGFSVDTYNDQGGTPCGTIPRTLSPGDSCSVAVTFSPNSATSFYGSVSIQSDDPLTPSYPLGLSGQGVYSLDVPVIGVDPSWIDFNGVPQGATSETLSISIGNSGSQDLHVSAITTSNSVFTLNPGVSGGCGSTSPTIAPGSSCLVGVAFTPEAVTAYYDYLTIVSDDPYSSPFEVSLWGEGTNGTAIFSVTPTSHDFGETRIYESTSPTIFTLKNTGTYPLQVSDTTILGDQFFIDVNAGDSGCGTWYPIILAGSECTMGVYFSPYLEGLQTATLRFTSDAYMNTTLDVPLQGTGVAPITTLNYTPTGFTFQAVESQGNPHSRELQLWTDSASSVAWTVTPGAAWLTATPTSGNDSASVLIQADVTGLAAGTYTTELVVQSLQAYNMPVSLPVTLEIAPYQGVADTAWPMIHHDVRHTARTTTDEPPVQTAPWTFPTGGVVNSGAAVGLDGSLYFGSWDGKLYSVWPDGSLNWTYTVEGYEGYIESSPAVGYDGTVYFGSRDGALYALNPDGTLRWKYQSDAPIISSPVIDTAGTVYVGSEDNKLHAVSSSGESKWTYQTDGNVDSSPLVASDGAIVFGSWDGRIYSVWNDGTLRWSFTTEGAVSASPSEGLDGTLYIGSWDSKLYAIDPATGASKWAFPTGGSIETTPAIGTDGTVFFGSWDGNFYALDPADGSTLWSFPVGAPILSSPAIGIEGNITFGSDNLNLFSLKPDGTLYWQYNTGDSVRSPVAIGPDGTVYAGSWDRNLYAIPAVPALTAAPEPLDFGGVTKGNTSAVGAVEIANEGFADLVVTDMLTTIREFSIVDYGTCGSETPTIAPGQNCTVNVVFKPRSVDAFEGALRIASNDPLQRFHWAPLLGTGLSPRYTLDVTTVPAEGGSVALSPEGGTYDEGTTVQVTATAAPGFRFVRWGGNLTGSDNPAIVTMDRNKAIEAVFIRTFTLTALVNPVGSGSVSVSPESETYDRGSVVALTATPVDGYRFDHWEGGATGTENPTSVTMDSNKIVRAFFVRIFTLTTIITPTEGGSVLLAPSDGTYKAGTAVQLTATPASGYWFDRWEGSLTGTANPGSITMDSNKTVRAVFVPSFTLTTIVTPTEGGSIALAPSGGTYKAGTAVQLTATPASGYRFDCWEGSLTGTANPGPITMDSNKTVRAVFVKTCTLTATASPTEGGAITLNPAGGTYETGTEVQATATPAPGYRFDHWEGARTGKVNSVSVTMNTDKTLTAFFVKAFALTVVSSPSTGGVVHLYPSGGAYEPGTIVRMTASPAAGYHFVRWEGDVTGTANPASITMDAVKSVTAVFASKVTIGTAARPAAGGSVILNPAGGEYDTAAYVTATASPNAGYRFDHWEGGAEGTNPVFSFQAYQDTTLIAVFVRQFTVTTSVTPSGAGAVSLSPAQDAYDAGTEITVTAEAFTGYRFSHWTGAITGSANPATLTVDRNKQLTAVFVKQVVVTTTANPTEGGTITMDPAGGTYDANTEVRFTAIPAEGYRFARWQGAVGGTDNPVTLTVKRDSTVIAVFLREVSLTTSVSPEGAGTVTASPGGGTYALGRTVSLTAKAASGFAFDHWEGALTGSANPDSIVMDGDKSVTAVFTSLAPVTVAIELPGTSSGDPQKAYRIIGIPVLPPNPDTFTNLKDFFGGKADPAVWSIYRFNDGNQVPITREGQDNIGYMKGWWMITAKPITITFTGVPVKTDITRSYGSGYQFVACPYVDQTVSWANIVSDPANSELALGTILYSWDGSGEYVSVTTLEPGKAYMAHFGTAGKLTIRRNYSLEAFESLAPPKVSKTPQPLPPPPPGTSIR